MALGKLAGKIAKLMGRMNQYQEAITFAEAGHPAAVRKLLTTDEGSEKVAAKLLIVGRESTFSQEIIDYALEMAQRMSYEIVALNTAPLSCETFKLFSSSRDRLCREFQRISEENAAAFRKAADRVGITLHHVIKFSEPDEALEEIKEEYSDIEFVISEAAEDQARSRVAEGERARSQMFVYTMV